MNPGPSSDDRHGILDRFEGPIEPVALTAGYRLALVLVAIAMVVLPLFYLGLVALTASGVVAWAVHAAPIWTTGSGGPLTKMLLYGAPLVVGIVLMSFLVKPLFAPRMRTEAPISLERDDQPLLFGFIDRLCATLGAPAPREVRVDCDVNASAGLRRGLLSLVSGELVLTIGLPLVRGLTVEQLAGVLAHELGHFAQRAGMRMSYVIRRVDFWFLRVVYERDAWDDALVRASRTGDLRIRLVMAVARGGVWISRKALWLLMTAGQTLSCRLLRQMELDADRYEARLVGSRVFSSTVAELFALSIGHRAGCEELDEAWREGRLSDSVPALAVARRRALEEPIARAFKEHLTAARTERFDTHPADPLRLASAHREGARGRFSCDLPAATLFRDLERLEREATLHFYRAALGDEEALPEQLVSSGTLIAEGDRRQAELEAAERVFHGIPSPFHPLPLPVPPGEGATGDGDLPQRLAAARMAADEAAKPVLEILPTQRKAAENHRRVLLGEALLRVRRLAEPERFGLASKDPYRAVQALESAEEALAGFGPPRRAYTAAAAQRVTLALGLLAAAEPPSGERPLEVMSAPSEENGPASDRRLLAGAAALADTAENVHALYRSMVVLGGLWPEVGDETREPVLVQAVTEESGRCLRALESLHRRLREVPYPFPHAHAELDLATYILPYVPDASELHPIFEAGSVAFDRLTSLYARILGALAVRVEQAEATLPSAAAPASILDRSAAS